MENNTLYEYNIVKAVQQEDGAYNQIKTNQVIVSLNSGVFNISIEDGELKIYKSDFSTSRISVSPQSSNVVTIK